MQVINKKSIPLPEKFKELHGYTILHLSDLHLKKRTKLFDTYFDEISKVETDIICITGDIIDNKEGINTAAHYLPKLNHRHGFYACLGNHDEYKLSYHHGILNKLGLPLKLKKHDITPFEQVLSNAGVTLLRNEFFQFENNGERIQIYGAYYPIEMYFLKEKFSRKHAEVDQIIQYLQKQDGYKILLSHSPDIVTALPKETLNLMLSGHTHGGFVQIPNYGPLLYLSKAQRIINTGIYALQDYQIHVSNGMISSKLIPRIGTKAEATILTLTYGSD